MTEETRKKYRRLGFCARCGGERVRFKMHCADCLNKARERAKKYYCRNKQKVIAAHKKRRKYNIANRLCVNCSTPLDEDAEPNTVECVTCIDKRILIRRINGR